eukprot:1147533-Pelagomonas_calceolata.AAC.4
MPCRSYNAFLRSAQRWRAKQRRSSSSPDQGLRLRGEQAPSHVHSPPPKSLLSAFEEARLNAEASKQAGPLGRSTLS